MLGRLCLYFDVDLGSTLGRFWVDFGSILDRNVSTLMVSRCWADFGYILGSKAENAVNHIDKNFTFDHSQRQRMPSMTLIRTDTTLDHNERQRMPPITLIRVIVIVVDRFCSIVGRSILVDLGSILGTWKVDFERLWVDFPGCSVVGGGSILGRLWVDFGS